MSVKNTIIDTIKLNDLSSFTLDELRNLIAAQGEPENSVYISRGLYKNIWNMKKNGLFELIRAKDPKANVYVVTGLLKEKYPKLSAGKALPLAASPHFLEALNQRLNYYSSELATTSAEIKEYSEIQKVFPEQAAHLSHVQQAAQERAFLLRGKLLAVESIIKSFEQ